MAELPLELPVRSVKPRERGITHLMDRGLSLVEVDGLMEVAGASVDIVKLGFGTALATQNLEPKLARYREHAVPVVLGGTITELAVQQDRVDRLVAWIRELGLVHIEVSDGTIDFDPADKQRLIAKLADQGFTVLSEVGSKDNDKIMAPYRWVELITAELEAGAWKVICEGRETGTAGIARPDGELRQGLIDEIAHGVDQAQVIFEAPQKDQQVHLIKRFGADVNLGNIPPADVLPLETMRLGLRSDTMETGA
ncbi:MAG: Phosphosulfolactate synthase [uncultured Solirubrobacteraceae bacterium]|uniref:Phosphosulfolactate synthase n=1 Tax=uncultured Solirubrobacteraceae bacterium TaxID=1162706 RepID=A0A6J4SUP8_9ACTN|nr:MAG: Phosphosulfolactate synthase [uncultured Solirubrobacteraceae bacterium]